MSIFNLSQNISVHECERLLGYMESVRPVTPLAALHYRPIQRQLLKAKKLHRVPDEIIIWTKKSFNSLKWWISRSGFESNCTSPLREPAPSVELWTDSNMSMAGACNSRGEYFQRLWSEQELAEDPHISLLEARSAKEAVVHLTQPGDKVRLHIDNFTALTYVKKQGGTRSSLLNAKHANCGVMQRIIV